MRKFAARALAKFMTIPITMLAACSHISTSQNSTFLDRLPPQDPPALEHEKINLFLNNQFEAGPKASLYWWTLYTRAQLWAQDYGSACEAWLKLSREDLFPLKELALLRSVQRCPSSYKGLPSASELLLKVNTPWLNVERLKTALDRARDTHDLESELKATSDLVDQQTLQRDKIDYLTRAIDLTKKLQLNTQQEEFEKRLYRIAPRLRPSPEPNEYLEVANDYRKNRDFETARDFYRRIIANTSTETNNKYLALDGIRLSFKLEKRTEDYLHANEAMVNFAKAQMSLDPKNWRTKFLEASLQMARARWTEHDAKGAEALLNQLLRRYHKQLNLDEVHWLKSRIHEEQQDLKTALKDLAPIQIEKLSATLKPKILWQKAWLLKKQNQDNEAIKAFEELSRLDASSPNYRALFWQARSLKKINANQEAEALFELIAQKDNLGFYGLLAHRELKKPLRKIAIKPIKEFASPFATDEEKLYFSWLIAVKEYTVAARFLDQVASELRSALATNSDAETDRWYRLLLLYARVGSYQGLFNKLSELPAEARAKLLEDDPTLLFPQPFQSDVQKASQEFSVPSELVYAIMRQESSFNPEARSGADAFGLMQVIPEVAKKAAPLAKINFESPEELYRPDINVPIGTAFLRELFQKYSDQYIPTIASYNASEKAILSWYKTRYHGDSVEFIEEIPYEETRGYVRLVLRNFLFYSRITSAKDEFPFPEDLLKFKL